MFTTTHHEEHPISTALNPTSAAPAEPAGPAASAKGPIIVWDLVVTILLLIITAIVDAGITFASLFLVMAADSCSGDACNLDLTTAGWLWAMIAPSVVLLIVIIISIVRFVKRRRAWWVALVGLVAMLIVWGIGVWVVFASVGAPLF